MNRFHDVANWRIYVTSLSGGTCIAIVVSALAPVVHAISQHIGEQGSMAAQALVSLPSVGIIVGGLVSGDLLRRMGMQRFFVLGMLLFSICGSAGLYLTELPYLLLSRLLLGFFAACVMTASITLIGDQFEGSQRSRVLGLQTALIAVTAIVVILASGALAEHVSWRAPFALYLFPLLPLLVGATSLRNEGGPAAGTLDSRRMRILKHNLPIYAWMLPAFVIAFLPNIQVSLLLAHDGITAPTMQSYVIGAEAVMLAAGALVYGAITRRIGMTGSLTLAVAIVAAGTCILGFGSGFLSGALGCAMMGFGLGIGNPLLPDLLIARNRPEDRGDAIGLAYSARYVGEFLNPIVVVSLTTISSLHGAFSTLGVTAALVAFVMLLAMRYHGFRLANE